MAIEENRTNNESAIRELIGNFVKAIRATDLYGVMSVFAPEVVSFDLGPQLQHGGSETFRKRWQELFESYQNVIDYELRNLNIVAGDDVAFSYSLNRISGTMKKWAEDRSFAALDRLVPEDQWQVAHCARTGLGSY